MPDLNDLKLSVEKLAQQAKETAEIGVTLIREQIHAMVPDAELVERMKQIEAVFDAQVAEAQNELVKGLETMRASLQGILGGTEAGASASADEAPAAGDSEAPAEEVTTA
ncbi:MAG: hypothetical protein VKP72_05170 [bacterium]|nr:hypothetical protein [bacterium]